MAGSYNHCVDTRGRFKGIDLLDSLGDAYEALEEMYGMIWYLAYKFPDFNAKQLVEEARQNYKIGLTRSPGVKIREE